VFFFVYQAGRAEKKNLLCLSGRARRYRRSFVCVCVCVCVLYVLIYLYIRPGRADIAAFLRLCVCVCVQRKNSLLTSSENSPLAGTFA
jgi:hypothetical protein